MSNERKKYRVFGLAVIDADGAVVYDLLDNTEEARDICAVLNCSIGPDWDAVSAELEKRKAAKS